MRSTWCSNTLHWEKTQRRLNVSGWQNARDTVNTVFSVLQLRLEVRFGFCTRGNQLNWEVICHQGATNAPPQQTPPGEWASRSWKPSTWSLQTIVWPESSVTGAQLCLSGLCRELEECWCWLSLTETLSVIRSTIGRLHVTLHRRWGDCGSKTQCCELFKPVLMPSSSEISPLLRGIYTQNVHLLSSRIDGTCNVKMT